MSISIYLDYVYKTLGLSEVFLPIANPDETVEVPCGEADNRVEFTRWDWECSAETAEPWPLVFVRLYRDETRLRSECEGLQLFENLRKAMGYSNKSAPWVELHFLDWSEARESLSQKACRCLLMSDQRLERSENSSHPWIIPDPVLLARHTDLKRPTWDLLKAWKMELSKSKVTR